MLREQGADLAHDFDDPTLLRKDALDQLLRRQMSDVLFASWILAIQIAVVREQFRRRHLPRPLVLLALRLRPPGDARGELLKPYRLGFGVGSHAIYSSPIPVVELLKYCSELIE